MTQAGGNQAGVPLPADITVGAILGPLSCVLSAISLCIIETGPCSKKIVEEQDDEEAAERPSHDVELVNLLHTDVMPVVSYGSAPQAGLHSTVFASLPQTGGTLTN